MDPMIPRKTRRLGPEAVIQEGVMMRLKSFDWAVLATHGNEYQMGFPDLWAAHTRYGQRWIEIKNPAGYSFTAAQQEVFPLMSSKGVGIWILTAATDEELKKLFLPPNWYQYLSIMR